MSKKYDTFAAYLEDVYYNQIFSKIKSYIFNNKGRLDLSTSSVPDPSYVELSDFKIMGVNFHESDTDRIECKVTVRAEIEISGRGRRDYESDSTECWISIPLSATLRNGLQQVSIGYASEYSRELFRAEDALTKYLVPYIYAKDLDKHAERFLEKYCPRALEEPMPLPIKEIVENMGLTVYHAPLPDGIFGRTYFNDANVEVFTNKTCSETEDRTICPGTILVNPDVVFMRNIGSTNNTVIHECVHWDKHYKFFELQKLLNPDIQEQLTSYEAQVDYYTNYIQGRDDWEFAGVYTDEGITGTNTKKREGFKSMVADALAGKIDLIITKSVSRFARNTVDSLTTIRSLKEHNVECYFEKENIWTFDGKGELLLTIMSSLAQEESRSISENCTWGQRKRFADGKVTVPFKRFLGYDMGPDHNLVVNPEQAKLVKRIYGMFLQGQSPFQIARTLTEEGIPSPGGKDHWNPSNIKSILTNEKYKGDALLQKTFTVDFLTKKKKANEGEIPQYYVKDNHEAIIDPETFEMVQTLMATRKKGWNRKSSVSIFSSKVKCGDCGSWYGPKVWHSNDAYRRVIWQCNHKFDGQKCATPTLAEDEIKELFLRAANQVIDQKEQFIAIYEQVLSKSLDTTAFEGELTELEAEINIAAELIEECIKENAHVALDQAEYQKRYDGLVARFDKAKARHTEITDLIAERMARKHQIETYLKNLRSREPLTEFRETDWLAMVDYITVHSKKDIRVTFKDGTEIKA